MSLTMILVYGRIGKENSYHIARVHVSSRKLNQYQEHTSCFDRVEEERTRTGREEREGVNQRQGSQEAG